MPPVGSLPQQENDPMTNKVINEIASRTSSPDPVVLPSLPEKNQSSVFLNILVSVFILVAGGVASYYLIATMHKTSSLKTSVITPHPQETVIVTEQYNNPFTPDVQYVNPFSTPSANPFDSLTSQ